MHLPRHRMYGFTAARLDRKVGGAYSSNEERLGARVEHVSLSRGSWSAPPPGPAPVIYQEGNLCAPRAGGRDRDRDLRTCEL